MVIVARSFSCAFSARGIEHAVGGPEGPHYIHCLAPAGQISPFSRNDKRIETFLKF
jgi:hypothetical protein